MAHVQVRGITSCRIQNRFMGKGFDRATRERELICKSLPVKVGAEGNLGRKCLLPKQTPIVHIRHRKGQNLIQVLPPLKLHSRGLTIAQQGHPCQLSPLVKELMSGSVREPSRATKPKPSRLQQQDFGCCGQDGLQQCSIIDWINRRQIYAM